MCEIVKLTEETPLKNEEVSATFENPNLFIPLTYMPFSGHVKRKWFEEGMVYWVDLALKNPPSRWLRCGGFEKLGVTSESCIGWQRPENIDQISKQLFPDKESVLLLLKELDIKTHPRTF